MRENAHADTRERRTAASRCFMRSFSEQRSNGIGDPRRVHFEPAAKRRRGLVLVLVWFSCLVLVSRLFSLCLPFSRPPCFLWSTYLDLQATGRSGEREAEGDEEA